MTTQIPSTSTISNSSLSATDKHTEFQITRYLPLVKAIAQPYLKHLPPSLELDDLVSVGMAGLWEAMARFDATKHVRFETFAQYRIRGAMVDEIRRMSWVSRGTLQHIELIKKTEEVLRQKHGHAPTVQDVANHLGTTIPWVDTMNQHGQKVTHQQLSWPNLSSDEEAKLPPFQDQTPLEAYEQKEQAKATRNALEKLPTPQSRVLFQYYFAELPMKTIGENLGLTESRVSQIHSRALKQLRTTHWQSPLRTWANVA